MCSHFIQNVSARADGWPGAPTRCTIHAARFCWQDTFWGGKTALKFLALHAHSLKALGVTFRLVGVPPERGPRRAAPPARLDLSATQLGSILIFAKDSYEDNVVALMPELLPCTLKHMALRSFTMDVGLDSTDHFVWGLQDLLDSAAKLPMLRTLSATCRDLPLEEQLYLRRKFARGICLSVRFMGTVVVDACSAISGIQSDEGYVFEAAASLHIKSHTIILECCSRDAYSALPRVLCPDSMQDCLLCASRIHFVCVNKEVKDVPIWDVVRMLLEHRSSAFAFACGTDDKGRTLLRWRRWPAPGSIAWHEAAAAHMATWLEACQRLMPPAPNSGVGQPAKDDDAQSDASSWLAEDTESEDGHG